MTSRLILLLAVLVAVSGCATVSNTGDATLAKNDDFLFVRVGTNTS